MSDKTKGIILLIVVLLMLIVAPIIAFLEIKDNVTYQWDHEQYLEHIDNRKFIYER